MRVFFRSLGLLLGVFSVQMKAEEKEVNVAGWSTASQSTVNFDWYPQNALDMNASTCTHTQIQSNPWWKLDLLKVYTVNRVVITNRQGCCSERINGTEIRVGNVSSDVFSNPICAVISSIPAGASYNYSCNRMMGRYVFVVIPGEYRVLTLCEVKVYVPYPGNLAAGGNVTQSSTYSSWIAEKAIDFNPGFFPQPSLTCSSTTNQTNPWWRLDLRNTYRVSKVVVTNRNDCCTEQINGTEIRIGNSLENNGNNNSVCAVISSIPAGVSSTYTCNKMEGRYVNLIIPGNSRILTLCEVEVYGGPYLQQTFVKLKLKSSSSLSEAAVRARLLTELESALAGRGISNVTLRWSQLPKQEVMRKEAAPAQCAQRRK